MGYPYPLTHRSFVFNSASPDQLQLIEHTDAFPDVSGRTPVLAVGSNQSPRQLARKFKGAGWGLVPTSRVHLENFDTVYSAHVTGYGSIAATLHPSPGTRVALYVNWLTGAQLEAMHKTELSSENYAYEKLDNVNLRVEAGPKLTAVNLYTGQRGAYAPEGDVIPLAEVPAEGRRHAALSQLEILTRVQRHLAAGMTLEEFVHAAINDTERRQVFIQVLEKTSHRIKITTGTPTVPARA